MEAAVFSETPVTRHQSTRRHNIISNVATVTKSRITAVCKNISEVSEYKHSAPLYVQHARSVHRTCPMMMWRVGDGIFVLQHFAVGADTENDSWCTWPSHRRTWCASCSQSATGLISAALRPRSYRDSGGQSTACHRGGPGSVPGQSLWDLWWTKWHSNRFL